MVWLGAKESEVKLERSMTACCKAAVLTKLGSAVLDVAACILAWLTATAVLPSRGDSRRLKHVSEKHGLLAEVLCCRSIHGRLAEGGDVGSFTASIPGVSG